MKKTIITISAILLLLAIFVSCNQDTDGIYRKTISSSAKSSYVCQAYLGNYEDNHYVLTSEGIICFKLDNNFKANKVETLPIGSYKTVRGAFLKDNKVSAIDANGQLFTINLDTKAVSTVKDKTYTVLSKSGYALTGTTIHEVVNPAGTATGIKGVSKIITDNNGLAYFLGANCAYAEGGTPITYDGGAEFTALNICLITEIANTKYVACSGSSGYEIHKMDGNDISKTAIATLSSKPTAAFVVDVHTIAYKTDATIDVFDADTDTIVKNKRDGWATDIYTSSTKTSEFVTIDGFIYAINISGGIIRIDVKNNKNYTVFTD